MSSSYTIDLEHIIASKLNVLTIYKVQLSTQWSILSTSFWQRKFFTIFPSILLSNNSIVMRYMELVCFISTMDHFMSMLKRKEDLIDVLKYYYQEYRTEFLFEDELNIAASKGNYSLVKYLLDEYKFVKSDLSYALIKAARGNYFIISQLLVENGAGLVNHLEDPLTLATHNENIELMDYLIDMGLKDYSNNSKNPILKAAMASNKDLVNHLLIKDSSLLEYIQEVLIIYVRMTYVDGVEDLINKGIDVTLDDNATLVTAALELDDLYGDTGPVEDYATDIVWLLRKAGATVPPTLNVDKLKPGAKTALRMRI